MQKILALNFYPAVVPPSSGGELRYFHIYKNLSKYYDITLLSPTFYHHTREIVKHSKTFREYRIPKEDVHEYLHREIKKEKIGPETSALECALSAKFPNSYHEIYLKLYPKTDIIIHESPYMLDYDLFFGFDDKPRVYNSYNVESPHVRQIWSGPHAEKYKGYVNALEKRLVVGSDLVFVTSGEERGIFNREFGIDEKKVTIAPNGINPEELIRDSVRRVSRKSVLFISSADPPSIEAANFIFDELSEKCSGIDFYIAGNCCNIFNGKRKPNVFLIGRIDKKRKKGLFDRADIAVNPMCSGSGTNLKSLEFLSSGIPLISTLFGVRGLNLIDGEHFVPAERENFATILNEFSNKTTRLESIARNGQKHVNENYSWENIAGHIRCSLETLGKEKKKKVILVVNDFEISNPTSGGEIRLNNMYTHLSTYYRILLLCLNNDGIITRSELSDDFVEISFPKNDEHLRKELAADSEFQVSVKDIINSHLCKRNKFFLAAIKAIESSVGAVIFVHPYMAPLLQYIQNGNVIYESLNCEISLKASILKGHPRYHEYLRQVERVERMVCARSRFIISTADEDHPSLAKLAPRGTEIITIENGAEAKEEDPLFDYSELKKMFGQHPVIVFIGSAHKPNIDALNFIIDMLASKLCHCYFVVIGTVCGALNRSRLRNLLLFGKMEEEFKDILLRVCDVAINPMFSGSGSNLKIAEYFAHNIPVISTPKGVRGYRIKNYREAIICEEDDFSGKILEVLGNKSLRETLAVNGFSYLKKNIDWRILAKKFYTALQSRLFF